MSDSSHRHSCANAKASYRLDSLYCFSATLRTRTVISNSWCSVVRIVNQYCYEHVSRRFILIQLVSRAISLLPKLLKRCCFPRTAQRTQCSYIVQHSILNARVTVVVICCSFMEPSNSLHVRFWKRLLLQLFNKQWVSRNHVVQLELCYIERDFILKTTPYGFWIVIRSSYTSDAAVISCNIIMNWA